MNDTSTRPASPANARVSERVTVALDARSYDILIGQNLLDEGADAIAALAREPRVFLLTDSNVARLYAARWADALTSRGLKVEKIQIVPGEESKNFATLNDIIERIIALKPTRQSLLLALGGGVIGDITGFAASIIVRGIDFVQIPTTLLAQVDSSVGGKTAVNSKYGKNLIGSFHQPRMVIADIAALHTLPARELLAGYAEIVKYGCINDVDFFAWCEAHGAALIQGACSAQHEAVRYSVSAKAAIVTADEREQDGRALLNLGHTFGHALEAETGYGEDLLHGEAVAIGICMAFAFSAQSGLCSAEDSTRVQAHLRQIGLPTDPRDIRSRWEVARMLHHFAQDKKRQGDGLTFILARGIGQCFVARDVAEDAIAHFLRTQYVMK